MKTASDAVACAGDPMSGEFDVRLATRADDADLRTLLASVPMPGAVALRFAREPDYFLGTTIMGTRAT